MKTILTIILALFTYISMPNNNKDLDLDLVVKSYPDQLYQVMWNEARGEDTIGIRMVLDVIRNRINSPKYPSTMDSVLQQKYQFCTIQSNPTSHFKSFVDFLMLKPIQYPYLHFINPNKAKKALWMRRKSWIKYNNHSFAL